MENFLNPTYGVGGEPMTDIKLSDAQIYFRQHTNIHL